MIHSMDVQPPQARRLAGEPESPLHGVKAMDVPPLTKKCHSDGCTRYHPCKVATKSSALAHLSEDEDFKEEWELVEVVNTPFQPS